jgi:hypothetical protein
MKFILNINFFSVTCYLISESVREDRSEFDKPQAKLPIDPKTLAIEYVFLTTVIKLVNFIRLKINNLEQNLIHFKLLLDQTTIYSMSPILEYYLLKLFPIDLIDF